VWIFITVVYICGTVFVDYNFIRIILTMKKIFLILFLVISGLFLVSGCKKNNDVIVPITLTDKSGSIFIVIDTTSKSFDGYSPTKITTGTLKGF